MFLLIKQTGTKQNISCVFLFSLFSENKLIESYHWLPWRLIKDMARKGIHPHVPISFKTYSKVNLCVEKKECMGLSGGQSIIVMSGGRMPGSWARGLRVILTGLKQAV